MLKKLEIPQEFKVKQRIQIDTEISIKVNQPPKKEIGFDTGDKPQRPDSELLQDFFSRLGALCNEFDGVITAIELDRVDS